MSTTLDENLNIISENENLEIEMLNGDLNIISKLDDEPNDVGGLTAAQLKHEFDKAGLIIQKYINETLIPAVLEDDATEKARAAAETARQEAESKRVSAEEERVKAEKGRVEAEIGRVTAEEKRTNAETSRAGAELGRETNETARVKAEQERVDAEEKRVAAESSRNVWEQYNALKEYKPGNKVGYKGSSYVNINASYGVAPDAAGGSNYWLMIAAKGKEGVDISGSEIDSNGHLILIYTDGSRVDCGAIASSVDWMENDPAAPGYVKNRTHWEEVPQEGGSILTETSVEFKTTLAALSGVGSAQIKAGRKYIVTWNGTAYECTAFLLHENAADSAALGNAALLGGENDTGEPFCLSDFISSGCAVTKSTEDAETVTIQIDETRVVVVHHLDPKYLPEGVPYIEDGGMMEILPETTIVFEGGEGAMEGAIPLIVGKTYTVNWRGVEYTCVAQDSSAVTDVASVLLGNGIEFGLTSNNEPFAVVSVPSADVTMMIAMDGSTEAVISVTQEPTVVHKLDNRCLDLAWLPIYGFENGDVVFEDTMHFENEAATVNVGISLVADEKYKVLWNGVGYELTARKVETDGQHMIWVGNGSLVVVDDGVLGVDTGEPFLIATSGELSRTAIHKNTATEEDISLKIVGRDYVPNKLPAEFLPEGAINGVKTVNGVAPDESGNVEIETGVQYSPFQFVGMFSTNALEYPPSVFVKQEDGTYQYTAQFVNARADYDIVKAVPDAYFRKEFYVCNFRVVDWTDGSVTIACDRLPSAEVGMRFYYGKEKMVL